MQIDSLADNIVDSYYENSFIMKTEDFRKYLGTNADIDYREVPPNTANKYRGDFHGLLDYLGVEKTFHYYVTRLNGLASSQDYDGVATIIIIPSYELISSIHATHIAKKR